MFLRNAWYVAATSKELREKKMVARKILNERIVVFRTENGELGAVEDRCIHRHAPLSLGKVVGETIQCGYHGACFDRKGQCVQVPGQEKIASKAKIRSYPVIERYDFIWAWMGDERQADESTLPGSFVVANDPQYRDRCGGEEMLVKFNYRLLNDNLFDVTHGEFVHPTSFGGKELLYYRNAKPGSEPVDRAMTYDIKERSIHLRMHAAQLGEDGGPLWRAMMAQARGIDEWKDPVNLTVEMNWWAPCYTTFSVRLRSTDPADPLVVSTHKLHAAVPETETTTNYFYRTLVSYGDQRLVQQWLSTAQKIFAEDLVLLEGQQRVLGERDIFDLENISFSGDQIQVAGRRILDRLINAEESVTAA
jgi:phenylpropionate dioxygenase-like ring-hydroxylating dioxygenase large terminal subunit